MKKLIILCFLFSYLSVFSQWEATSWRSDPNILNIWSSEKILILSNMYDKITVSYDKGKSWQISNTGLPDGTIIYSMVIKGSTLFLGTFGNLYISEDLGRTWRESKSGLPTLLVVESMVHYDGTVFAGTWGNGVYCSADNGKTWKAANNGIKNKSIYALAVLNDKIFASTGDSLFVSSDMGQIWEYTGNSLSRYGFYDKIVISENIIFISSTDDVSNGDRNKLYLSTDFGDSWIKKNSSVFEKEDEYSIAAINDRLFVGTADSLYYSDDYGETWINTSIEGQRSRGVGCFSVKGGIIYAGSSIQLYSSTDMGEKWTPLRDSISYGDIYKLIPHKDEIYVCVMPTENWQTYDDGLFVTTDKGETFIKKGLEEKWVLSVQYIDNFILACTNHGIFKSEDNGVTWRQTLPDIFAFSLVIKENIILIPYKGGYFISTDFGETWKQRYDKFPLTQFNNVMLINNSLMFAGLDSCVYISFDNGDTWENRSKGLPKANLYVKHIVYLEGKLFIGTNYGVFLSSDLGENWYPRNNGLPKKNINYIYINAFVSTGKYLFAGLSGDGVYFSSDFGDTWEYTNCTNFGNLVVTSLALNDGYIFASTAGPVPGTRGSGIYKAKLSDFGITDVKDTKRELGTIIYPNPVGNYITLSENDTKLYESYEIYDISGRLLQKSIFDSNRIDISALESGSYYLRLLSPSGVSSAGFLKMK
jgi:photosystem II stability/assembly factor-like uncharacterized protein